MIYGTGAAQPPVVQLADISGTAGFRIDGAEARGYAGIAVTEAGDVNGDGIDDIITGSDGQDLGKAIASAGDINGDGIDDLVVTADFTNSDGQPGAEGSAYVIFGKAAGFGSNINVADLNGRNGFRIDGGAASSETGFAVSAAGDVNHDGFDVA